MKPNKQQMPKSNPSGYEPENFMFCNIGVSFHELRGHFEFLKESWKIFEALQQRVSKAEIAAIPVELLLVRTCAAFLGTSMMALGGILTEAMTLTRSMIENAVYASFIHNNPEMADIWTKQRKMQI
jgi:hypothetical protein